MKLKTFSFILLLITLSPVYSAPINDNLDSAINISKLPYTNTQDTSDSTTEPAEGFPTCTFSEASVWYQYSPTIDEEIVFDTYGSDYDTVLGIWTGEQHPLTEIICNDNGTESTMQSQLSTELSGGTKYLIGINGFNKETGKLTFNAKSLNALNNDNLANAITIKNVPYAHTQQVNTASTDANEVLSECATSAYNSVWYQYKSNTTQSLTLNTLDSDYNTILSLWIGSKHPLTELDCNDDVDDHHDNSQINVTLEANKTYYINVSSRTELDTSGVLVFNLDSKTNLAKGSIGMAINMLGSEIETESYFLNQIVTKQEELIGNQLDIDASDAITITVTTTVDDFDFGETADILILALLHLETPVFFMRGNDYLTWELWNGDIPSIIAAEENIKLSSTLQSTIYEGSLAGLPIIPYTVYIGYRLEAGKIVFNGNEPVLFKIINK